MGLLYYTSENCSVFPALVNTLTMILLLIAYPLSIHMYVLSSEGLHTNQAFATEVALLVAVILINTLASFLAKKIENK